MATGKYLRDFKEATSCAVFEQKGGEVVYLGKNDPVHVLKWCKAEIDQFGNCSLLDAFVP